VADPLIVVPDDFPSVFEGTPAHERCRGLGETRVYTQRGAEDEAELIHRLDRARIAINIRAHARFTDGVFAACPKLQMVSIWGTGTDNIDLNAAGRRGITVCNTPGVNAYAVAEHTLALMLAVARKLPKIDAEMRAGAWPRDMLTQLYGKTLGIFGTGQIGTRVAELGRAVGMQVLVMSARDDSPPVVGARAAWKEEILREADVITVHLRLLPETRGFLARKEFAAMKRTAILVNTGRGALVERDALLDALRTGKIAGAGLDVFDVEPLPLDHPYRKMDNVVLTPHLGYVSAQNYRAYFAGIVDDIRAFLDGKPVRVMTA
jgi:phosphoglycerate dehydrogenase-like enzyme